ncbi:uncharacterized mitochondrial protein AtMg00810-like [Impatiens glandulifera]|uniref:uncharacterized mitochondrial protein AtMg00810-like n=1 Tax=Impatiens glandulifera TaxID=253017 RepID=UPI001FB0C861|nr:uncharacterized mitochondrial protein AtMg00810-like [Impatiens glandulifera]
MAYFLGMEIMQKIDKIFIYQKKYAKEILKKFKMEDCKSMSTHMCHKEKLSKNDETDKVDVALYRRLIGCLMYLIATRPNILHDSNKKVLRYVRGTPNFGIKFNTGLKCSLQGYSDWSRSIDDIRSTSSYCFSFGSGVFSWCCKKQEIIAQSTVEIEFIIATTAANQALWGVQKEGSVKLKYCKTELQLADIFTKALPRNKFEFLKEKLGIYSNSSKEEC